MTTENTSTAPVRLFDAIVADPKNAKKTLNSKLVENAIKRKFQAAFDDAEAQKDQAQIDYNAQLADLDGFDVNTLVDAKQTIKDAELAQDLIKETYAELFGEDLN